MDYFKKMIWVWFLGVVFLGGCMEAGRGVNNEGGWKKLFDGKSLAGWHQLPGGQWEVRDGVIIGTSDQSEARHGMLMSDERYGDFVVRLKFKAVKGNSGLYFRTDKVKGSVSMGVV